MRKPRDDSCNESRFWLVSEGSCKGQEDIAIYTFFIQHVLNPKKNTKRSYCLPTGFLTAKTVFEGTI
jgi:hypothetical protein